MDLIALTDTEVSLFMFQMCHVQEDWFTENVMTSWMTSAMEGLETLLLHTGMILSNANTSAKAQQST